MIGVAHLAGEAAAAVLLLEDVPQQRAGVRRAGNDADLGKAAEVLVFLPWLAPSGSGFYRFARRA